MCSDFISFIISTNKQSFIILRNKNKNKRRVGYPSRINKNK